MASWKQGPFRQSSDDTEIDAIRHFFIINVQRIAKYQLHLKTEILILR